MALPARCGILRPTAGASGPFAVCWTRPRRARVSRFVAPSRSRSDCRRDHPKFSDSPAGPMGELSKMPHVFSAAVLIAALGLTPLAEAAGTATLPYNVTVQSKLQPQLEALLVGLVRDGRSLTLDGIPVFNGKDKFLPGKIAISLVEFILSLPPEDPRQSTYLKDFRQVARLTVDDANDTWGAYYYILALDQLRKAGLLQAAVDRLTLAKLRVRLDWRTFVDADDFTLIDHPNNYYCVALGIARLRTQMGWEEGAGAQR